MDQICGEVALNKDRGNVAFCQQRKPCLVMSPSSLKSGVASSGAWLQDASIRDNILFALPYEANRYNKVVEACCLLTDFRLFESGDLTQIGERGILLYVFHKGSR